MMTNDVKTWERGDGVAFLKKVGLRSGHHVLDFGARVGHYAIPAARIVAPYGDVYAVDKDREALDELQQKAETESVRNIVVVETDGSVTTDLPDGKMDVVLLFDVLHFFDEAERERLYQEVARVLKPRGLVSVYPRHTSEDLSPAAAFDGMTIDAVRAEIEQSGLSFRDRCCGRLSHNESVEEDCVLNFCKAS